MTKVNATSAFANYTDRNGLEVFIPPANPFRITTPPKKAVFDDPPVGPFSLLGARPSQAGLGFLFFLSCKPSGNGGDEIVDYRENRGVGEVCYYTSNCREGLLCYGGYDDKRFCSEVLPQGESCNRPYTVCVEGLYCYYGYDEPQCLPGGQSGRDEWCDADDHCQEGLSCYEDTGVCMDLDSDNDGLRNADDACPLEKGPVDNAGCPEQSKGPNDGGTPPDAEKEPPISRTLQVTGIGLSVDGVTLPGVGAYSETLSDVSGSSTLTFYPGSDDLESGSFSASGYSAIFGAIVSISSGAGNGSYTMPGGSFSLDERMYNASFSDPSTSAGQILVDSGTDTFEIEMPMILSTTGPALSEPPVGITLNGNVLLDGSYFIQANPTAVPLMAGNNLNVEVVGNVER